MWAGGVDDRANQQREVGRRRGHRNDNLNRTSSLVENAKIIASRRQQPIGERKKRKTRTNSRQEEGRSNVLANQRRAATRHRTSKVNERLAIHMKRPMAAWKVFPPPGTRAASIGKFLYAAAKTSPAALASAYVVAVAGADEGGVPLPLTLVLRE